MNYSNEESACRIDFFKPSGKWYTTAAIRMEYESTENHLGIIAALRADPGQFRMPDGAFRFAGMWAVVIDPFHKHAHPQMFVVPDMFDLPPSLKRDCEVTP